MQVNEEIRDAVKTILARMETHPEDFEFGGKLHWITKSDPANERGLNAAEIAALALAVEKYNYGKFSRFVMESLLSENEDKVQYQEAMRLDSSGNLGIGTSLMGMGQQGNSLLTTAQTNQQSHKFYIANKVTPSIQIGSTAITEADLKKLKAL